MKTVILLCIRDLKTNKPFCLDTFLNNNISSIFHGKSEKSVRVDISGVRFVFICE